MTVPYHAKEPGLGSLEKLPPELRRDILEIVLEIDQPIGTRMCCGILGSKQGCCLFHQQLNSIDRAHQTDRTRFAPLIISRPLRHEALWVLYNRIKLYADVSTLMLINKKRASIPYELKNSNMWRSISQFRHVELVVPAPKNSAYCREHTEYLLTILCQFLEHWEKQDKPGTPDPAREMTIHLGGLFNAPTRTRWDPSFTLLDDPYLDNLEQAVELIVVKDWNVKFTFTAVSEISDNREHGKKSFNAFTKLLGNVGIDFVGKTLAESSVSTIAFRGALGGTHSRFIG